MYEVFNLAFALLAGLMMTRLFNKWHLPDVTAFLIAGVLIGPYVLGSFGIKAIGFTTEEEVSALGAVSNTAMGFIAFSMGSEFRIDNLKKTGRQAFIIGIFQACVATVLTDTALIIFSIIRPDILSVSAAITLGAIAAATAPAATLMVVRQYKAKGELTSLLLPIVALDDAVGLIIFAVSFGIARALQSGSISIISVLVNPLIEILASAVLGCFAGWVLHKIERMFHSNTNRTAMVISFVFMMVAISSCEIKIGDEIVIGFSSLLVCMFLGTVFCNTCVLSGDIMDKADVWSKPLLSAFFVISGAELRLSVFSQVIVIGVGIVYIMSRSFGKYLGARLSSQWTKCSPNVVKYLGITLLPQAGVALGMCVSAEQLGQDGVIVKNIILFSVLIYELFGPLATKKALECAGEISSKPDEVVHRRERKITEARAKK